MIRLMIVSSQLQDNRELQENIEKNIRLPADEGDLSGIVIIVATGGTEREMEKIIKNSDIPIMLWALPDNNSLGAALEVYSIYKDRVKIFYGSIEDLRGLKKFERVCDALEDIKHKKIGLIGGVSDWILTSDEATKQDIKKLGPEIIEIETEELLKKEETSEVFIESMDKSLEVYRALKSIAYRYHLDALSIRCFDLLKYDMTACIGLALLNDEGIVAGCEGDLQAVTTMVIASEFSKKMWMANVARMDEEKNTITFAHCTIASTLLERKDFTTHMESGKGVAIRGPLKEKGEVTIVRFGGRMDRVFICCGEVVDSDMGYEGLCRMQVEVKLNMRVREFLEKAQGNHHVIVFENVSEELRDLCKFRGIKIIEAFEGPITD